jgi:hypothetical protein
VIIVKKHKDIQNAYNVLGPAFESVRQHISEAFPDDAVWKPEVEGYAVIFDKSDVSKMFPCSSGDYKLLDPAVWEEVKFLPGGVFAIYVVQNNEMCSIAYVPDQDWVPAILRDMMKSFIN